MSVKSALLDKNNYNIINKERRNLKFRLTNNSEFTGGCIYNKKKTEWEVGIKRNNKIWTQF